MGSPRERERERERERDGCALLDYQIAFTKP